jgi:predicted Ser/Thr protein kinase
MAEGLAEAPVFSKHERQEYAERVAPAEAYVLDRQEADVLEAMLEGHQVDAETVEEYVEQVYAWAMDEPIEDDRGRPVEPDPLVAKVFEVEHLGRFSEADYDGTVPNDDVEAFRREQVITALNRHAWERRGEDFRVGDVDLTEVPAIADVLASNDWDDVRRIFEDFDPRQWEDPPAGTETARVKAETIDRLLERGYSPASAELTSRRVVERVRGRWGEDAPDGEGRRDPGGE